MNCDQAFDQMTQPGGGTDPLLQSHLAECRRCREMQETLAPAIELFEADARAHREEPWRTESESTGDLATHTARRLTEAAVRPRRLGMLLGYAAAVLLGAGLVWGTLLIHREGQAVTSRWSQADCLYIADGRPATISTTLFMQSCLRCHQAHQPE
jgi:predicted anti-sigma-YlaC factor YlaD